MRLASSSSSPVAPSAVAFTALATFAALAVTASVFGCSTAEDGPPPASTQTPPDASVPPPDASRPPPEPPPSCTMEDIPQGKGGAFCDLPGVDAAAVQVPEGFCVREYATVTEARVMKFAPNGDLFLAAPSMGTPGGAFGGRGGIVVLPDDDHDGRADAVLDYSTSTPADGRACAAVETDPKNLTCVHGMLFDGGYLYYTRSDEVRRYPYVAGQRTAPSAPSELVAKLGGAGIPDVRWTHTLEKTKSGSILVSRGRFDSSSCSDEEMARGAVFGLDVAGRPLPVVPSLVADGFRNPMYLRCSPASCGECYASELSGDNWDGVGGTEKLSLLGKIGQSWGYPCCVGQGSPHPSNITHDCASVGRELVAIPLHDTNFGLDFDRGGFPEPYRHGLFVALHGVFTSFGGTGVVWLPTDPGSLRPVNPAKVFASGFRPDGRATDVAFAPDGRLFVADDTSGKIYWIAPKTLRAP